MTGILQRARDVAQVAESTEASRLLYGLGGRLSPGLEGLGAGECPIHVLAPAPTSLQSLISGSNAILHPWLKELLSMITETLPRKRSRLKTEEKHSKWKCWQEHLKPPFTLPEDLPTALSPPIASRAEGRSRPTSHFTSLSS